MRVEEYAKYINVLHDLALVEDDLRETVVNGNQRASAFAQRVLYERFGVDLPAVE
jgi:hypothetical protein